MKIIIDECLPKRVTQFFEKGSAYTVPKGEIEHIS